MPVGRCLTEVIINALSSKDSKSSQRARGLAECCKVESHVMVGLKFEVRIQALTI